MTVDALTPLESAVLDQFRLEHTYLPAPADLLPSSRDNTGVGRFTTVPFPSAVRSREVLVLSAVIEMDGVEPPGLGAVLFVEAAELTLELHTFIGGWDGVERAWKFQGDA